MKMIPLWVLLFSLNASADAWECAPITGHVPFSGSWVFTDGANFVAGDLPSFGRTMGDIRVTRWETTGEWQGQSYSGLVSFRATGHFPGAGRPYFSYPAGSGRPFGPFGRPGTVNIDGTISLSAQAREEIREAIVSGLLSLPGVDRRNFDISQVCVSEIAMNVGRSNGGFGGQLRGGSIFLYLNNTRATYQMRF